MIVFLSSIYFIFKKQIENRRVKKEMKKSDDFLYKMWFPNFKINRKNANIIR